MLDLRTKNALYPPETNASLDPVEQKIFLSHLAKKHRFLGRPARCLTNKQTGRYTYENSKTKNIQRSESRLGEY
jgi:hypothetical protein